MTGRWSLPTLKSGWATLVRMRKPHPCGSADWEVVRLGADIGIRCQGCSRRVLLPRSQFIRQVKTMLTQGPAPELPA